MRYYIFLSVFRYFPSEPGELTHNRSSSFSYFKGTIESTLCSPCHIYLPGIFAPLPWPSGRTHGMVHMDESVIIRPLTYIPAHYKLFNAHSAQRFMLLSTNGCCLCP